MALIAVKILNAGPTIATYIVSESTETISELEFKIDGRAIVGGAGVWRFDQMTRPWWR